MDPFYYNKKVYLPVNAVSKVLGREAFWIQDKSILWIRPNTIEEKDESINFHRKENTMIVSHKISKTIEAKFVKCEIMVDETIFMLKDKESSNFELLMIGESAYLPFNILAEALGKESIWSDDTKSIYFQKPERNIEGIQVNTGHSFPLERIEEILKEWTDLYEFVDIRTIGKSFEDRPIYSVVVNYKKEILPNKEKVLLLSGIHAREDYSVMLNAKMLDNMLFHLKKSGVWGDFDLETLFSQIELHVILVANPDGLNIVNNGIEASENRKYLNTIKNISKDHRWWKANGRGVDLNRNFPDSSWKIRCSEEVPASEGYKGPYAGSETETQSIVNYCNQNNFILSVSYHTSGNKVFWADRGTHDVFQDIDSEITDRFIQLTNYDKLDISEHPETYGSGFENWFRERYHRPSFCVELSPYPGREYVQHPNACFDFLVWKDAKYSGALFMKQALELKEKMYDVHLKEVFEMSFYTKKDAIEYAAKEPLREVWYLNDLIWKNE